MFVNARFVDKNGKPIAGVEVDIWHSSTEGFYENQDPVQADMNLRGKFTTDKDGRIAFRSIKPAGYPIPIDGPTGDLLRAQGRHNMRPAHLHFLASKDGFKTLISQIYVQDDKFIDTDVQFGVTRKLIGNYVRHENEPAPAADVKGPWYSLDYTFTMEPGTTKLPRPPITGKAQGRAAADRTAQAAAGARLAGSASCHGHRCFPQNIKTCTDEIRSRGNRRRGFRRIRLGDRARRSGWTVRMNERRDTLAGEGYGIAIHNNMARIFAKFGILERVLAGGMRIDRRDSLDRTGRGVMTRKTVRSPFRIDRQHIIALLPNARATPARRLISIRTSPRPTRPAR